MRKMILLSLGLLVMTSSVLAAESKLMQIDNLPNCKLYHGYNKELDERVYWSGRCIDGLAHGVGVAEFWFGKGGQPAEGRHIIEGQFVNGQLTGAYSMKSYGSEGVVVEELGTLINGNLHGPVSYEYANGTILNTYYEKGVKVGEDLIIDHKGNEYTGLRDQKGFQGKVRIKFSGKGGGRIGALNIEFKDNLPGEVGEFEMQSGWIVKGPFDFKTRSVNGEGEIVLHGGGRYAGLIKNNKPYGRGVYEDGLFVIRAVFDGSFFDGEGEIRSKTDSRIYTGVFKGGEPNGRGTIMVRPGYFKKGTFVDGRLEGHGRILLDGMTIAGEFENGDPVGKFTLPLSGNGDCFIEIDNDYMPIGRGLWVHRGEKKGTCHFNGSRMVLNRY
ncbi:MAG: hypothetical protein JJ879_04965 [Sneathiella sp.]|nr:hypothetical protein [Sneathiella sp.]